MSRLEARGDIEGNMEVGEAIRRFPATTEVFDRYGIDASGGASLPIDEAAVREGADPEELLRALNDAAGSQE